MHLKERARKIGSDKRRERENILFNSVFNETMKLLILLNCDKSALLKFFGTDVLFQIGPFFFFFFNQSIAKGCALEKKTKRIHISFALLEKNT